jgi:hypothetical protein
MIFKALKYKSILPLSIDKLFFYCKSGSLQQPDCEDDDYFMYNKKQRHKKNKNICHLLYNTEVQHATLKIIVFYF